jgi:hypothetical protein
MTMNRVTDYDASLQPSTSTIFRRSHTARLGYDLPPYPLTIDYNEP